MKIRDEIIRMIKEGTFVPEEIAETANLCTDLGYDSLGFVRLLLRIEQTYSIAFGLMEMGMCLRLDRLIALAQDKVEETKHDSTPIDASGASG